MSGVNPTDWQARSGAGHPKHFLAVTPHLDGAGTIDAVGEGIDQSRAGLRVWVFMAAAGRPTGTAAEFTVVPAERAVPLPDEAAFAFGASLGVPALTAGGYGAVRHAVIQLARWAGATVISTISGPEKARLSTAARSNWTCCRTWC